MRSTVREYRRKVGEIRREMKQEMITWDVRSVSKEMTRLGLSNIAIGTFDKEDSLHVLESPFL